jgi:cytochrome P450
MTEAASTVPLYPMKRDPRCPWNPPPELKQLQAEAPVSKVRIWNGNTAWLVTRFEDVRFVLKDPRFSADVTRPGYPPQSAGNAAHKTGLRPNILAMDDPEHAVFRRMQAAYFRLNRMEALRPRIQHIVDAAIDAVLASPQPVDLVEMLALPVPSLVISELLGVPFEDHDFFQRCTRTITSTSSTSEQAQGALAELKKYMTDLVRAKDIEPTDDFVSALAVEQVRTGLLTAAEVADMAVLVIIAGHETTANMIAMSTVTLLQHPDQLDEIRDGDAKLIANAVEELLRYIDVAHIGRRRVALADVEVGGQLIRAGEGVIAAHEIGNRDGRAFESPDMLDIHQDARQQLAFGYGIHQCLGQAAARIELQVVLSTLFRRIPTLQLALPLEQLDFNFETVVYGLHKLPVTW